MIARYPLGREDRPGSAPPGRSPGTSTLQRMPSGPHSRARFFVRLCTAAFVIEYVKTRDSGVRPDSLPTLMMLAPSPVASGPLDEVAAELLAGAHDGELVDGDEPLQLVVGDLEERRRRVGAGAVDEHVDPAVRAEHPLDERAELVADGRVARLERHVAPPPASRSRDRASPFSGSRPTTTVRAPAAGERLGHAAAEHAGAADAPPPPARRAGTTRRGRGAIHARMLTPPTPTV